MINCKYDKLIYNRRKRAGLVISRKDLKTFWGILNSTKYKTFQPSLSSHTEWFNHFNNLLNQTSIMRNDRTDQCEHILQIITLGYDCEELNFYCGGIDTKILIEKEGKLLLHFHCFCESVR